MKIKEKLNIKKILVFVVLSVFWWFVLVLIGSRLKILPCYSPSQSKWFKCFLHGITITKMPLIYFNSLVLERIYLVFYHIFIPISLSLISIFLYKMLSTHIKSKNPD